MSQFQIIIGCQFVNKGISQEVINSVLRGGGRGVGNGKATRGLGRRSRLGSCLWRGERRDPLANSCGFRQGASPRRADTSGDQRHSETFQACPLFHNEMSLSRTRRLGSTAESNLKESGPSKPARSVPKGERRWCLSSLQPTFQVFPHLSRGGGGEWERLKLRLPSLKPRRAWVGAHPAPSRDVRWLREALGPLQGPGEAKKSGGGGEDTSQLILLSLRHSLGFLESFFLLADPAPFSCPAGETSSRPPWASQTTLSRPAAASRAGRGRCPCPCPCRHLVHVPWRPSTTQHHQIVSRAAPRAELLHGLHPSHNWTPPGSPSTALLV